MKPQLQVFEFPLSHLCIFPPYDLKVFVYTLLVELTQVIKSFHKRLLSSKQAVMQEMRTCLFHSHEISMSLI